MTSHPSLRDVQHWVKSRIQPSQQQSFAADVDVVDVLNPQRGTPGAERLAVYAEGYRVRIREALAEVYEAIQHLLGEQAFAQLADAYAAAYPSHDYNLSFVGRSLPIFLKDASLTTQYPFLPDLARLEWLVCMAFHAPQHPPINPHHLERLSLDAWEHARLIFQPGVGRVASAWPILDVWAARTRPVSDINIDLVNRPQRVIVFRHDDQVRCELIGPLQDALLVGLLERRTLGQVCEELSRTMADEPLPVTQWCAHWMQQGLIVGCQVGAES